MKTDWQELITTSYPDIRKLLDEQAYEEAKAGLDELYGNMANADKGAFESQLRRLMVYILKWRYRSAKRSVSWVLTIVNARQEISLLQKYMPSLNRQFIDLIWYRIFTKAVEGTKEEMDFLRTDKLEPALLT